MGAMTLARRVILSLAVVIGAACGGWADGISQVEEAIGAWDRGLLSSALGDLNGQANDSPRDARLGYWQSVAAFHTVLMGKPSDEDVGSVLETVRRAHSLDPGHREINAMLCVLYGLRIQANKMRAVWLGPRVMSHSKAALALPENPRALYLVATCRFYGGRGKKDDIEAMRLLNRAEELFDLESRTVLSPTDPRWGRAECARFIKIVSEKLKRTSGQP
jgi:hypothetical protein